MYQDHLGHLWIGTSDGLNIWNGHSLEMYDPKDGKNFFAGNTVLAIFPDMDNGIWLRTYYGIAHIDIRTRGIEYYNSLTYTASMTCNDSGIPYLIGSDKKLHYFNTKSSSFEVSELEFLNESEQLKCMNCYGANSLYCFTSENIYLLRTDINEATGETCFTLEGKTETEIRYASFTPDAEICHFIPRTTRDIYAFNMATGEISLYAAVGKQLPGRERFRALLPHKGGLYIGLSASGVYYLSEDKTLTHTPIGTGIFALIKDNRQDIVWAGTDGSGVMNWHTDNLSFEEIPYSKLPVPVKMPTRSILLDRNGRLWCGTKGDGIFTISGFSPYMQFNEHNVKKLTIGNSALTNNNVFSITEGGKGTGIWIGTDGPGLNWYSYSEDRVMTVPGSQKIGKTGAICQQDDNTLWVGTHGRGLLRCEIKWQDNDYPQIVATRKFPLPEPFTEHENIFAMHMQNDSTLWIGTRGTGAASIDLCSGTVRRYEFPTDNGVASNDIYSIAMTDSVYFASGCGLATYDLSSGVCCLEDDIPNRATHGILTDNCGCLWMSTNYGIICHNASRNRTVIYNQHSGLRILEYSDGAAYKDGESGNLFFGGINGLTVIRNTERHYPDSVLYIPEINITHQLSNGTRTRIDGSLALPYSDNTFGIKFSVVDNINYPDYEFSYRINGFDDQWKSNGNDDIIHLPTLPPGRYVLEIRYHNNSNSYTSQSVKLPIRIIPPVYATWWAKTLYALIVIGVSAYYLRRFRLKYLRLKEELRISKALYGIDHSMVANMYRIINENLDNPDLSVAFIADKMCISKQSLYRKLEKAPHIKPQKIIREQRMEAAANMMKTSKMTIDEIMYKVGYDNRSTFYKNFKEQYGVTPKEYRQGKE